MESKTSVSEDREIKLSTRQNTARGFAANMDRANNSYIHQFEKTAHSPHYLGLYHYHAPARGHKYTRPRIRMQNHINSNSIDMVINMLITPQFMPLYVLREPNSIHKKGKVEAIMSSCHQMTQTTMPEYLKKHTYIQITYSLH